MFGCFRPKEQPYPKSKETKEDAQSKDVRRPTASTVSLDYSLSQDTAAHKQFDASSRGDSIMESRMHLPHSARTSLQLGSGGPPPPSALPFTSLNAAEALQLNQALTMIQAMVQRFADLRHESASLRSLQQALVVVTTEWPGALARLHVASRDNALLLAMAPRAVPKVTSPATSPQPRSTPTSKSQHSFSPATIPEVGMPVRDQLLVSLSQPGLAMSAALDSIEGCYYWINAEGKDRAPPPDYEPYVVAGAQAIFSVVIKLSGATAHAAAAAVLTLAFPHGGAQSPAAHVELWSTYVRLIASGMATLFVGSLAPRYLAVALELSEAYSLDAAMASVVRRLRELSGQSGNTQLWFRVALVPPFSAGHAVLFDLPSEVLPALCSRRPSSALDSSYLNVVSQHPRPGAGANSRDGSLKGSAAFGSALANSLNRTSSTPSKLPNNLLLGGGGSMAVVLRTVVTTPQTLLRHVVDRCQQVVVPDLQKLLNQGGMVAADIFSVSDVRPPASVLLLPLVRASDDGHTDSCFGGVYCMSGVLTDFADVKQHLCEAIVEVLSPHLLAAIGREPLATEFLNCRLQSSTLSIGDRTASLDTSAEAMDVRLSRKSGGVFAQLAHEAAAQHAYSSPQAALGSGRGHGRSSGADRPSNTSPFTSGVGHYHPHHHPSAAATNSNYNPNVLSKDPSGAMSPRMTSDGMGLQLQDLPSGSARSSATGNSIVSCPASYTNALVTGLTDKISMHRTIQSMDTANASSLADLQFLGLLGTGGFGYVFQGKWRGIMVAIKLVKCPKMDDGADRAALKHAHEIAILSSVSHPNIIQAYAFMTDVKVSDVVEVCIQNSSRKFREDTVFSELLGMEGEFCHVEVLELCDQGTVVDALQRGFFAGYTPLAMESSKALQGALMFGEHGGSNDGSGDGKPRGGGRPSYHPKLQTLLLSLVELASALAHLHSLGIVHCDIKPDNVLLKSSTSDSRGFTFKLADFGLSRVQDDQCLTFPCNSCGTLAYVAPEALSNKKVDHSIDVYSFGILMYELYANRRPYATTRQEELLHAVVVLGMRPVFRPGSHVGYVSLARACWDPVPANRPNFNDVISALNHMLSSVTSSAAPTADRPTSPAGRE